MCQTDLNLKKKSKEAIDMDEFSQLVDFRTIEINYGLLSGHWAKHEVLVLAKVMMARVSPFVAAQPERALS